MLERLPVPARFQLGLRLPLEPKQTLVPVPEQQLGLEQIRLPVLELVPGRTAGVNDN
jgi:hypothetical protein